MNTNDTTNTNVPGPSALALPLWIENPPLWARENIGKVQWAASPQEEETIGERNTAALNAIAAEFFQILRETDPKGAPASVLLSDAAALADRRKRATESMLRVLREANDGGSAARNGLLSMGGYVLPASSRGLRLRAVLREEIGAFLWPGAGLNRAGTIKDRGEWMEAGTDAATVRDLILGEAIERSGLILSAGISVSSNPPHGSAQDRNGFAFWLRLDSVMASKVPTLKGKRSHRWSPVDLDGYELDGSDVDRMRQDLGFCDDGTAEFFDRFGIGYDREYPDHECDSCGTSCESDDQGGFSWIEDLTFDARMIAGLEKEGKLEEVTEWIAENGDTMAEGWEEVAYENTEELAARFALPVKAEECERLPRFDATYWECVPSFEDIEGLDDLESSALLRLLPAMAKGAEAWIGAGYLPPVPCTLIPRGKPLATSSREPNLCLEWNPENGGAISHTLPGAVLTRCESGVTGWRLTAPGIAAHRAVDFHEQTGCHDLATFMGASLAGTRAALAIPFLHGEVSL